MKRLSSFLKTLVLAATVLTVAGCASHKKVTETAPVAVLPADDAELLNKMSENMQKTEFVTSKIKFTVEMGSLKQSLTGNLRMKRNEVIRLQLMAFGFVEAGRLEFTKDEVLLIDRINKQYLQVPYEYVDFLRKSGINFYTLQAMFWNELFLPGKTQLTKEDYSKFTTNRDAENAVLSYEQDRMAYSWLTDPGTGLIRLVNIIYTSLQGQSTQLNWDYASFTDMDRKKFPNDMRITLTTPDKEVKMSLKLNYIGHESDWEPRTQVSTKYRKVDIDSMLRRFMAL